MDKTSDSDQQQAATTLQSHGQAWLPRVYKPILRNWITFSMLTAIILGIIVGCLLRLRPEPYTRREIMGVTFLGNLLMRILKALTIPLFLCSVVSALAQLDMKRSGKIGVRTLLVFLAMSLAGTLIAMVWAAIIRPGAGVEVASVSDDSRITNPIDNLLDFVRNLFPDNVVGACLQKTKTELHAPKNESDQYILPVPPINEWDIKIKDDEGTNYIGLVLIAVIVGIVMGYLKDETRHLYAVIEAFNEIFITITRGIIMVAFVGFFCIMVGAVIEVKDLAILIRQLGLYVITNFVILFCIMLVILPLMFSVGTRKLPFRFMYNTIEVIITALSTSSSIATVPVTMMVMEKKNHIHPLISRFVIPLGATVNMAGAGAYMAIAPMFLAQMRDLPLNAGSYMSIFLMASLSAVGAAGIPAGGLVGIMVVMDTIGVPKEDIGIIMSMDFLIDRIDTACNVYSDCLACGIVQHLSRKELGEKVEVGGSTVLPET